MLDLSGRVALVTGSSRGIGRACALRLARAGADVVVNYLSSESAAREVAREIQLLGRRAILIRADVSEEEDVREAMKFIDAEFGRLDVLVSNAASGGFRPLSTATDAHFQAAMNTNVRALLWLVQAGLPLLKRAAPPAKVIAISSRGSQIPLPLYGLIGASKAALESMMRHYALELGGLNITFNTVQAGFTDTDSTRSLAELWQSAAASFSKPSGARITPDDVAGAVLFLASSLSNKMQGQTLVVDDGAQMSKLFSSTNAHSGVHQE
jgi:enoyl-[acyl-carrier protein] reductase III